MAAIDLQDRTYNRLTCLERIGTERGYAVWKCRCACGNTTAVRSSALIAGDVKSCGCLSTEVSRALLTKHGGAYTPLYRTWKSMMNRCNNKKNSSYPRYGGRGISVCDRWYDFSAFNSDMGEKPKGTTLERIDNDAGYSPENCRWATPQQQANNRRSNKTVLYHNQELTYAELARIAGVGRTTMWNRLHSGLTAEEAVTRPLRVVRRTI